MASKKVFHDMYKQTYGTLYEQNSYLFMDLFKELENYYAKGMVSASRKLYTSIHTTMHR